jgi:hypothetical protein
VAALLITVRNKARQQMPRREGPPPQQQPQQQHAQQPQQQPQGGDNGKGARRRDRRRRAQVQQVPMPAGHYSPPPTPDASARQTGIGAWLAPDGTIRPLKLEFRVHVRQGGLTVTVLDVDNRQPMLPSTALGWQATSPSQIAARCGCSRASRAAIRVTPPSTSAAKTRPSFCHC